MKVLISILAMLGLTLAAHAVTLQAAEWFIDSDPGEGSGTAFTGFSGGTAALDLTIPAATINGLGEGAHLLGVRFQDSDGAWGHVVWRSFLNQHPHGGLAAGEYFFDADPGEGAGTPLPGIGGDSVSMTVTIPPGTTNALSEGAHLLGVRFRDGDDEWGHVVWRVFGNQHPHGGLAVGEYFFNTDPGMGSATPLVGVGGGSHAADHAVPVGSLPEGANLLGVRFQDGDGEWGPAVYRVFCNPGTGLRTLNRVEFVVYRGGVSISSGSVLGDGSVALNVTHEPPGVVPVLAETLLLELQVVDDSGRRSHKVFREIPVQEFTESFRDLFFTVGEQSDPLVSGDGEDPDGDGLATIIEQWAGLHPREPSSTREAGALVKTTNGLQFRFRAASEGAFDPSGSTFQLGGLLATIEVTTDFTEWTAGSAPEDFTVSSASTGGDDGSFLHVVDLVTSGREERFYRLRVERE